MYAKNLIQIPQIYSNDGQHKEQMYRYTVTGKLCKADNKRGADCEGVQIKSARATICKGTDIAAFVAADDATAYAYVSNEGVAYVMTPAEYTEFATLFATATQESTKNGGAVKMRFKSEGRALMEYLHARV